MLDDLSDDELIDLRLYWERRIQDANAALRALHLQDSVVEYEQRRREANRDS